MVVRAPTRVFTVLHGERNRCETTLQPGQKPLGTPPFSCSRENRALRAEARTLSQPQESKHHRTEESSIPRPEGPHS